MTIEQGANDANIICYIAGALTSTIGVIIAISVITLRSTRPGVVWGSIPLIVIPLIRAVIVPVIGFVVIPPIRWASVAVIAPTYWPSFTLRAPL